MKKFISFVAAIAVLFSLTNCRETDELSNISENNYNISSKKDSVIRTEASSSSNTSKITSEGKDDPPKKDDIKW